MEMRKPSLIRIEEYDYPLSAEKIAKYPLQKRDLSKLLYYENGEISGNLFTDLPGILSQDDHLVFNATRVVKARMTFRKESGAKIEIFCLRPAEPSDYQQAFSSTELVDFICLVGNAKKWKEGLVYAETSGVRVAAEMLQRQEDKFLIRFRWNNKKFSFAEVLENLGNTPIPPYLNRDSEDADVENYQTVYANEEGSVAAPTAGLHFSLPLLDTLKEKGITQSELILHVGAGTFVPVKIANAVEHPMHSEIVVVSKELLKNLLSKKRIIAVGTTSTRSLESIYWLGVKACMDPEFSFEGLSLEQWEPYELLENISLEESLTALIHKLESKKVDSFSFQTRIMITPGYEFKVIKALFTNFHQPKSTLLLLIAAFVGDDWKKIYQYALENNFRFLSYGDSSLLVKN